MNLSDMFSQDDEQNSSPVAGSSPVSFLQQMQAKQQDLQQRIEAAKNRPEPSMAEVPQASDVDSLGEEALRGFLSGTSMKGEIPSRETFDKMFRQNVSPGRELLANVMAGMSASFAGTKFRDVRSQAWDREVETQKLNLEKQQIQRQTLQGVAGIAQQIRQQRGEEQLRKDLALMQHADSEAARAIAMQRVQQTAQTYNLNVAKFAQQVSQDADKSQFNDKFFKAAEATTRAQYEKAGLKWDDPKNKVDYMGRVTELARTLKIQELKDEAANKPKEPKNTAALVDAVMANPEVFDRLTPSARTAIAPDLAKAGFAGFGKPLGEIAVKELGQTKAAIDNLQELRQNLTNSIELLGPAKGWIGSKNPFNVKAQIAQAELNRVKQRVGKALEGGVLRKEDEDKYQKILATLADKPETALSKIDGLVSMLHNDVSRYLEAAKAGGRDVSRFTKDDSSPKATHRFNPATGKIEVVK